MDKETAIKEFLQFKEECLLSRDKSIEVFTFFKYNPEEKDYTTLVNNAPIKIQRKNFWDILNTTDIRNIYKKPKQQSEKDITNDDATSTDYTKLRKECVTVKNKLNFERNVFNKKLKEISSLEELNQELINNLKKLKPIVNKNDIDVVGNSDDILLVQLSDLHINELTNEFRNTNYDIDIANKRLKKFAQKIKKEIINNEIKKVVIAMTGDLCNSDSILSKQQNNATDKATSIIMATKLLEYFILDIYKTCCDISIVGVAGNEGRFMNMSDFYTDENLVVNSPDFIILNFLEMLLMDVYGIKFLNGRNAEQVVNINGSNILFTHGVLYGKGDMGKAVQQTIARYADKGVNIRYSVSGHLHSTKLSNFFMRSASLVGNNSYATTTLNLNSRASQNIAFVGKNGDISPMAIDLENVNDITGYDISDEIRKFNIKSAVKNTDKDFIHIV